MDGDAKPNRTLAGLVADMAELVARAFFGGIAAAVAMGAAILFLSTGAQAQPYAASMTEPWSVASPPEAGKATGADALWARPMPAETGEMVQALGALALLSAVVVVVVARRIDTSHDSMKVS